MELFINENAAKIFPTIFAQIWNDLYFQIAKIFAKRNMDIFSVVQPGTREPDSVTSRETKESYRQCY